MYVYMFTFIEVDVDIDRSMGRSDVASVDAYRQRGGDHIHTHTGDYIRVGPALAAEP